MDYRELAFESAATLALNKTRTFLAMLGVIIGIGSVIALMSLGQASQKSVQNQIKSLGANLLTIMPGAQNREGVRGSSGSAATLTDEDAQAIETSPQITTISNVAAEYRRSAQVAAGRQNTNTQILGVSPNYAAVRNIALSAGSFISQQQNTTMAKVAVLGSQTAEALFGENVSPIGKTIRIASTTFTVVGLCNSKGGSGPMSEDDRIYVPLATAQKILFGANNVSTIYAEAKDEDSMSQAQNEIGYLLLSRHKIKDPTAADFSIMSQEDLLETTTEVTKTFTTLLSGIAAISLIVGGIGIMNIMLVTVTERTREIGLRKALGARNRWINAQFLTEATIITFFGGIIGILSGTAVSFIISSSMSLPPTISISSILLAFGVSASIGIIFGWYPAQKAARLSPIEALRYE